MKTVGLCPTPCKILGLCPKPCKTLGALPPIPLQDPRTLKPWDSVPHPARGVPPLDPVCAGAIFAPAEAKIKFLPKKTACGRGIAFSDSQAVFLLYSIIAPANACICACQTGSRGRVPLWGLGQSPKALGSLRTKSQGLSGRGTASRGSQGFHLLQSPQLRLDEMLRGAGASAALVDGESLRPGE